MFMLLPELINNTLASNFQRRVTRKKTSKIYIQSYYQELIWLIKYIYERHYVRFADFNKNITLLKCISKLKIIIF